jgi:HPt (histidine-containing phosphotransfer) domain-containing protein
MEILDESRFAELWREFPPAAVVELVRTFLSSTPVMVERIVLAAEADDREEVAHAAHRLKGGCLAVGAGELNELAGRLERVANDAGEPGDRLRECAARLEAARGATRTALRSRIDR